MGDRPHTDKDNEFNDVNDKKVNRNSLHPHQCQHQQEQNKNIDNEFINRPITEVEAPRSDLHGHSNENDYQKPPLIGGNNNSSILEHWRERFDLRTVNPETKDKLKAGLFLGTISGLSILGGFGTTMALAKRQDPNNFAKGISGPREIPESGISLASRALARGTFYSVAGFSLFCFTIWKMLGVHNLTEFRHKVGSMLPTLPKSENPGRSDFRTIRELFQFIIDEDEKEKKEKGETENASKT